MATVDLLEGSHPIVPVMFGDAIVAAKMAHFAFDHGVYVTAFSYPVVPQGKARIRVQLSAAHTFDDIHICIAAFVSARATIENNV